MSTRAFRARGAPARSLRHVTFRALAAPRPSKRGRRATIFRTRVTVPDKSATMVMLLSLRVPGEAEFLFAPSGGVPESSDHPFRVARFANRTGGTLERGPIAVFEEGSFLRARNGGRAPERSHRHRPLRARAEASRSIRSARVRRARGGRSTGSKTGSSRSIAMRRRYRSTASRTAETSRPRCS